MKKAFSMIELIFIIIILGVLGATIKMNMPDNRLLSDRNFILQKIKEKQMYALSYDNFDYKNSKFIDGRTCIAINRDSINSIEKKSKKTKRYLISSKTTISPDDLNICFDNFGRPYKLNNFLKMPIELNISYKSKIKTVNIMPYSGQIIKIKK